MVQSPRCVECSAPITVPSGVPCERCQSAWEWLVTETDPALYEGWLRIAARLHERTGGTVDIWLSGLTVVLWQNGVLTLAGWERNRRWIARRYSEVLKAAAKTDKQPVFVSPRVGVSIARRNRKERP